MTKRYNCEDCGEYSAKRKVCVPCKEKRKGIKPTKQTKPQEKKFISPEEALKHMK